jgi:protein tyrosine/serine phosphatase
LRLDWEGCAHARDLGGLPTTDGRRTRPGALVRAGSPDRLSAAGWAAVAAHGVQTVVDLRNPDEIASEGSPRPEAITTLRLPLDGTDDREFWGVWATTPAFGTPLYYRPFLERFPHRAAAVLDAIAQAPPGGVLYHCGRGRDRAGLVTMLVLDAVGVEHEAIADDYILSVDDAAEPELAAFLRERGTTARDALLEALDELPAAPQADALRLRLVS